MLALISRHVTLEEFIQAGKQALGEEVFESYSKVFFAEEFEGIMDRWEFEKDPESRFELFVELNKRDFWVGKFLRL